MKKIVKLGIVFLLMISLVACGSSKNEESGNESEESETKTVSTDGSTSMEKVIGALGESFMANNSGVTFTYNPTGSGSGICCK